MGENTTTIQKQEAITYVATDEQGLCGRIGTSDTMTEDEAIAETIREIRQYSDVGCVDPELCCENAKYYYGDDRLYAIPTRMLKDGEWEWDGDHISDVVKIEYKDEWGSLDIDKYEIELPDILDAVAPDCESDDYERCEFDAIHEIEYGLEENPGVWGHGAGVIYETHCIHPYCYHTRTTNTWDHKEGNEGYESVAYGMLTAEKRKVHDRIYGTTDDEECDF